MVIVSAYVCIHLVTHYCELDFMLFFLDFLLFRATIKRSSVGWLFFMRMVTLNTKMTVISRVTALALLLCVCSVFLLSTVVISTTSAAVV